MQKPSLLLPLLLFLPHVLTTPPPLPCPETTVFTYTSILYSTTKTFISPSTLLASRGSITFNLSNSATAYTLHCSGAAVPNEAGEYFNGTQTYWCADPDDPSVGQTNFEFDARAIGGAGGVGRIMMVPRWWCGVGVMLKQWMGLGNVDVNLECKRTYWQNPTWEEGEVFSLDEVKCGPGNLTVEPPVVPAWGGNGGG